MTTLATDDFNRADGGLGGNWTTFTGFSAPQIASNTATDNAGADSGAVYSGVAIPDNHWAQVVRTGGDGGGVVLRGTPSGTAQFYVINIESAFGASAHLVFGEFNGASFTSNSDQVVTFNSGDTLYGEMQGSQAVAKRNGAALGTALPTDSTWTTGDPGIFGFSAYVADDFAAGDFASAMGAVIARAKGPGRAPYMARNFPAFTQGRVSTVVNDMSAAGALSITGVADLDATGTLSAAGALSITGTADLDARGSLVAAGALSITGAADLDARGNLLAVGALSISGLADLDAIGQLLAAGSVVITGAADLSSGSTNDMSAAGALSITGSADLDAIGQLVAAGTLIITGSALLTDGGVTPPVVIDTTQTPAGRKLKKRYEVVIDGKVFEVDSYAEAERLLMRARDLAKVAAAEAVRRATIKIRRKKRDVTIDVPVVTSPNPELQSLVNEYSVTIEQIYQGLARDAEIRQLLRLKLAEEADEEDAILLLLH